MLGRSRSAGAAVCTPRGTRVCFYGRQLEKRGRASVPGHSSTARWHRARPASSREPSGTPELRREASTAAWSSSRCAMGPAPQVLGYLVETGLESVLEKRRGPPPAGPLPKWLQQPERSHLRVSLGRQGLPTPLCAPGAEARAPRGRREPGRSSWRGLSLGVSRPSVEVFGFLNDVF